MPWSEWITPEPVDRDAFTARARSDKTGRAPTASSMDKALALARKDEAAKAPITEYADPTGAIWAKPDSSELVAHEPGTPAGTWYAETHTQQQFYWHTADKAADPDYRDWFPQALQDLKQGVDYDVIPGKDEQIDEDAFVEYEPGVDTTFAGWRGTVSTTISNNAGLESRADVGGMICVDDGTRLPLGGTDPIWAEGLPVLTGTSGVGAPSPPADLSTRESRILVLVYIPFGGGVIADSEGFYTDTWMLSRDGDVAAMIQLPRFRYWIPDASGNPLPLRQRQRDDGLELSTARWRKGTSRQASNRWRGYL